MTTPRYKGSSFGTNMMEVTLTADDLNGLIDELGLRLDAMNL
jgi:hypothetical protein